MRTIDYNGYVPDHDAMNHDAVVCEIQARARARGVLSHYCGPSLRCTGDRGKPDLVLVGNFGVAWIEVKMPGDCLDPEQTRWRYKLRAAGQLVETMGPGDLVAGGAVDQLLELAALGAVA